MNEEKRAKGLILKKGEATKIIIRIRYSKKPKKLEKINKLINILDYSYPIPLVLKKLLKKDIPCLILLNNFINPKYHYNTTDEIILSKAQYLKSMVTKIQIVCHRASSEEVFWKFVKLLISYFNDQSQYPKLHNFFSKMTNSQDEMKFLLSFTNSEILYSPIEIPQPKFSKPIEKREDYLTFLHLIGIDTTPIDDRYKYKKEKLNKSLKSYFNIREDYVDLTKLPAKSYSYRDNSFLMESPKISNSTPFYDMIINSRYFNMTTEPISNSQPASQQTESKKSEKQKETKNSDIDYEKDFLLYYAISGTELLHDQEYRMGLLEMSLFELKNHFCFSDEIMRIITSDINFTLKNSQKSQKTKSIQSIYSIDSIVPVEPFQEKKLIKPFLMLDHWRVLRALNIIYERDFALSIDKKILQSFNNGYNSSISEKIVKIMRHLFISMVKMRCNWYNSQYQAFINYSFSKGRIFPHPENCQFSIENIENYNYRSAVDVADYALNFCNAIMQSYSNCENDSSNRYLMDGYNSELLTLFSQYYKFFICYYFYPYFIRPPLVFVDSATRWRDVFFFEMNEILSRSDVVEPDDYSKVFKNENMRKKLAEMLAFIVKKPFKKCTQVPNLVIATFQRVNNGLTDDSGDSILVNVKQANKSNMKHISRTLFLKKIHQNNVSKNQKKSRSKK